MPFEAQVPNIQLHSGEPIRVQEVFKFGGSSLATGPRINAAVKATLSEPNVTTVIVSANGNNTDYLINLCDKKAQAEQKQPAHLSVLPNELDSIVKQQIELAQVCIKGQYLDDYIEQLKLDQQQIDKWLDGTNSSLTRADVIAFGEVWSARLFASSVKAHNLSTNDNHRFSARWIDARDILRFNKNGFCQSTSFAKLQSKLNTHKVGNQHHVDIVTGFVAKDHLDNTLLLGRNGSDYSASLIASLLGAKKVTFWTDVDGVYSADPNNIEGANKRKQLSYQNAFTLSQLGSPVLHHRTLSPLESNSIDLTIRKLSTESAHTSAKDNSISNEIGSRISHDELEQKEDWIVHVKKELALVDLDSVAEQYPILLHFEQESAQGKSLALIDPHLEQLDLNPEHTACGQVNLISVITNKSQQLQGWFTEFFAQLSIKPIQILTMPNALIALVSDEGFSASNASSSNIESLLHNALTNQSTELLVGLIGPGQVGSEVLNRIARLQPTTDLATRCRFVQLANSKQHVNLEDLSTWSQQLAQADINDHNNSNNSENTCLVKFSRRLKQQTNGNDVKTVIIDTTGSEQVAAYYSQFFNDGHNVITANKVAGSSNSTNYQLLKNEAQKNGVQWRYESTVGAGLPVIKEVKNLIQSGDRIREIQTICSGSLAYIFSRYSQGTQFSDAVLEAKQKGFTEPDPRLDLSGVDIARKLVILAREAGANLELDDINLPTWLPEDIANSPTFEIATAAPELNAFFDTQAPNDATALVPLAKIKFDYPDDTGSHNKDRHYTDNHNKPAVNASLNLENASSESPFFNLLPGDNLFLIKSDFYNEIPLIVRGPGAGATVTAAGVLSDLLSLLTPNIK